MNRELRVGDLVMLVRLGAASMVIADEVGISIGDYGEVVPDAPMAWQLVARMLLTHGMYCFVRFRTSSTLVMIANGCLRKIDGELRRVVDWDWRVMLKEGQWSA